MVQKTVSKANTKTRVNGQGSSEIDAFIISNSEDDHSNLFQFDSLIPSRQAQKMDSLSSEDDLKLAPTHVNHVKNGLIHVRAAHARGIDSLQLKLRASEAKVGKIKDNAAREAPELQGRQRFRRLCTIASLYNLVVCKRRLLGVVYVKFKCQILCDAQ